VKVYAPPASAIYYNEPIQDWWKDVYGTIVKCRNDIRTEMNGNGVPWNFHAADLVIVGRDEQITSCDPLLRLCEQNCFKNTRKEVVQRVTRVRTTMDRLRIRDPHSLVIEGGADLISTYFGGDITRGWFKIYTVKVWDSECGFCCHHYERF